MSRTEHRNQLRRPLGFFLAKILRTGSNHLDSQLSGYFHYAHSSPPHLGIGVRSTAYRDCGVLRTPMPPKGHGSSLRLVCRTPLSSLLHSKLCPLLLQTTELYRPAQSVGCAPNQDLEPPGSVLGSSRWTAGLSLALFSRYWDLFLTDCLRVLSLS